MPFSNRRSETKRLFRPPVSASRREGRSPARALRPARFAPTAACLFFALVVAEAYESSSLLRTLADIHAEVKSLGARPGQDFISEHFFIGSRHDGDDDDTYKDRHVAIMIQDIAGRENMSILVTRMEAVAGNPRVRNAGESRSLSCAFTEGVPSILRSDFGDKEALSVAREILKAVRNKKRLLNLRTPLRRADDSSSAPASLSPVSPPDTR